MLKVEGVVCGYGKTAITKEITMEFGNLTLIYGPNGVGKSTFLKTVAGILNPVRGRIVRSAGRDTFYLSERIDVPEYITPRDYVLLHCALYGVEKQKSLSRLGEALDVLGITHHLTDVKLAHLSNGQKRLMQLTVPYVLQRRVNLLDDPLIGIDRKSFRVGVKDLIAEIADEAVVLIADRDDDFWDFVDRKVNFAEFSLWFNR